MLIRALPAKCEFSWTRSRHRGVFLPRSAGVAGRGQQEESLVEQERPGDRRRGGCDEIGRAATVDAIYIIKSCAIITPSRPTYRPLRRASTPPPRRRRRPRSRRRCRRHRHDRRRRRSRTFIGVVGVVVVVATQTHRPPLRLPVMQHSRCACRAALLVQSVQPLPLGVPPNTIPDRNNLEFI